MILKTLEMWAQFQSTLPGWGATAGMAKVSGESQFQSTLPGWGATVDYGNAATNIRNFNPRSPDGERLETPRNSDNYDISIHAPRMGSDGLAAYAAQGDYQFQSTLPGWGATGHSYGWRFGA